ncbi:cation:proton antiporter, partial [Salmonella enterica subsp. enterica serovar 1,4,[5],12:i:-]
VEEIHEISELGVLMLLFLIGLELRPKRLWLMRRAVFGLGTAQLVVTTAVIAAALVWLAQVSFEAAIVLGAGLALSST